MPKKSNQMKTKFIILSLIATLSFICRLGADEVIMMDLDNDGIPETEVVVMDGITVAAAGMMALPVVITSLLSGRKFLNGPIMIRGKVGNGTGTALTGMK